MAVNLRAIRTQIGRGDFDRTPLSVALLCDLHGQLFHGVRSHAGRYRSHEYGTEYLTFGPNRSLHRDLVPGALERVVERGERRILVLLDNPGGEGFEEEAINVATQVHADIIGIHPFQDGNGRTCRALLDLILHRLGMRPLVWEAPKKEYHNVLNHYYATSDFRPLADMALTMYAMGIP